MNNIIFNPIVEYFREMAQRSLSVAVEKSSDIECMTDPEFKLGEQKSKCKTFCGLKNWRDDVHIGASCYPALECCECKRVMGRNPCSIGMMDYDDDESLFCTCEICTTYKCGCSDERMWRMRIMPRRLVAVGCDGHDITSFQLCWKLFTSRATLQLFSYDEEIQAPHLRMGIEDEMLVQSAVDFGYRANDKISWPHIVGQTYFSLSSVEHNTPCDGKPSGNNDTW